MARIRTIKPEFFTSEDICSLSPLARLFYQACWCEADRSGLMEWKPRTMKLRYFPADDCDIDQIANEVIEKKLMILYDVNGKRYAEIPSFSRHQHLNPREAASIIPRNDASSRVSDAYIPVDDAQVGREGKGREGKEDSEPNGSDAEARDDLKAIVFGKGLDWLAKQTGKPRDKLRSALGRACRDHGDATVIEVLAAAQREGPIDPLGWMERAFAVRASPKGSPNRTKQNIVVGSPEWKKLEEQGLV